MQRNRRLFVALAVFAVLALTISGLAADHAAANHAPAIPPHQVTLVNQFDAPEPYLGVGSPLAATRTGDPNIRMQGFWLSINSPGTDKQYGDPFTAKWDYTPPGSCCPIGGQFQPDHDTQGYNYGLYLADGTDGYLQVYDPAYQPKPGYVDANGVGHINPNFDANTHCGDPNIHAPAPCPAGQPDFNNIATRWCADNAIETGDYQPGAPGGQCDTQSANATTIYSLYYPDSTPDYYGDDVLAAQWTVTASPITGTDPISGFVHSYVYSQTWSNFNDAPDPGYHLSPINGNHQWRLNVNVPLDNDHTIQGVAAQNNFGIRVKTSSPRGYVRAYPLLRFPLTISGGPGLGIAYLAYIPPDFYSGKLIVSLFDAGDDTGDPTRTGYIQLLAPPNNAPAFFDIYKHDYHVPPSPDIVFHHIDHPIITSDGNPQTDYNDEWADAIVNIPWQGEYEGGFWQMLYVGHTAHHDRMTMQINYCTPNSTTVTADCPQSP